MPFPTLMDIPCGRVVGPLAVYPTTSVISLGISAFYGGLVFMPFLAYHRFVDSISTTALFWQGGVSQASAVASDFRIRIEVRAVREDELQSQVGFVGGFFCVGLGVT